MLFELIAAIVAGFAGAGVILMANKLLGGRLPRWLTPAGAGLAMLAMAIVNEYGWYPRTVGGLPEGLEVATTAEDRAIYRPWTYVVPFVTRFLAVDTATMRTNDALPGQRISAGTRKPPSQLVFFSPRNGEMAASGHWLKCGPLSVE